MKQDP